MASYRMLHPPLATNLRHPWSLSTSCIRHQRTTDSSSPIWCLAERCYCRSTLHSHPSLHQVNEPTCIHYNGPQNSGIMFPCSIANKSFQVPQVRTTNDKGKQQQIWSWSLYSCFVWILLIWPLFRHIWNFTLCFSLHNLYIHLVYLLSHATVVFSLCTSLWMIVFVTCVR